jgi:glycosyltransferase involved in cell wall biosynthesis
MLTPLDIVRGRETSVKQIVVAQLGARQDYTVPIALQDLGCLERFYTDAYVSPQEVRFLQKLGQVQKLERFASRCLSRTNAALQFDRITRFNLLGIRYLQALRKATSSLGQYQAFMDYGEAFNQAILQRGLPQATHLYGFDHAALRLFKVGRSQNMHCILDQIYPGPYHEKLVEEECDRWSDWKINVQPGFCQSSIFQRWHEIQLEEWQLAHTIVVASQYARWAIGQVNPAIQAKIRVVPLTVNLAAYLPYQRIRRYATNRPLQVLFVGRVSLPKGIHYLLQAFAEISPRVAQLSVVGNVQIHPRKVALFQDRIDFRGVVPHLKMPEIYQTADVLVFPTISDGFGGVMLEAMATGLPVIATDHCGDIVEDGVNGYRIPIRQQEAIATKIHQLTQKPELLTHLSEGAIATSQQYTLSRYQFRLSQALNLPTMHEAT